MFFPRRGQFLKGDGHGAECQNFPHPLHLRLLYLYLPTPSLFRPTPVPCKLGDSNRSYSFNYKFISRSKSLFRPKHECLFAHLLRSIREVSEDATGQITFWIPVLKVFCWKSVFCISLPFPALFSPSSLVPPPHPRSLPHLRFYREIKEVNICRHGRCWF